MATTDVPISSASFDMIGSYLAARATCPACQHVNVLVHVESYASPVKVVDVCGHIRALGRDDDDERFVVSKH